MFVWYDSYLREQPYFFWYFNPPDRIYTGNTKAEQDSHNRSVEIGKKIGKIVYERIGYYAELKKDNINRSAVEVIYEMALANAVST